MQHRLKEARVAVAGSPYEPYLMAELTVPEVVATELLHGPLPATAAMAPSVTSLNEFVRAAEDTADCGYSVLDGPTLFVQSRVDFPGSDPEMFRWWFWWHALDVRRYMLWFPYSHVSSTADDPVRLADTSLSFEERFYDNRHHVVEWLGSDLVETTINFVHPTRLGIDRDVFDAAGFEASASGLLEFPGLPDVTVGMMVHIVRRTSGGMELFSRYWLGTHPALARFPGHAQAAGLFEQAGITASRLESTAYELAVHDMTEWNNLARILPRLYAEFGPGINASRD